MTDMVFIFFRVVLKSHPLFLLDFPGFYLLDNNGISELVNKDMG